MPEHQIGALWIGGPLSYLEQLCLVSFRDAGHHVILWTYDEVPGVPEGIEERDGAEILPMTAMITHDKTGSPAPQADKFRYHMLSQVDRIIWADTDAYCLKPFETANGHFYGWESEHHVNNGVLGLPKDSDTLGELLAFTADEYAIPPWFDDKRKREYEEAKARGEPVGAGQMSWGVWGPQALTHFLHATGEVKYALPREALYPIRFKERRFMTRAGFDYGQYMTEETRSIHFYGRRMRKRIVEAHGGTPPPTSLIGELVARHKIDMAAAPIPYRPKAEIVDEAVPAPAAPPRLAVNPLTEIADARGSDQGSRKHRFTELYHMLLSPLRDRPLRLLGVGQSLDGGEAGVPSAAIWLDYLPQAEVIGVDPEPFAGFAHDRLRMIEADWDDADTLAMAAETAGEVDVIIDDATHASAHQQEAFLAFWPKLRAGGLYVIEDLRWQPGEESGTKTAALFQSFLQGRRFTHDDPAMEAAFNALAPEISGCFVFQAHFDKTRRDQVAVIHKL